MQKMVAAAILTVCGGGCLSVDHVEPEAWDPPVTYRRPRTRGPEDRSAPQRTTRADRNHHSPVDYSAWVPHSGRISRRWTTIVIHHSGTARGGAKVFDRYHRKENGWGELGYHFVIGNGTYTPDGYVEVGSRWHKQKHGAHCKTPTNYFNEHGIGICLVGNFEQTEPTPRQLASLNRLVRFLRTACAIPSTRVTTHGAINSKTRCPGRNFDVAAFRRSLTAPSLASSMP